MPRRYETLREAVASRLRDASAWDHRPAEVHQPSEESPSRDDHLRSCKGHAQLRHYQMFAICCAKLDVYDEVLPKIQPVRPIQLTTPQLHKAHAV